MRSLTELNNKCLRRLDDELAVGVGPDLGRAVAVVVDQLDLQLIPPFRLPPLERKRRNNNS